MWHRPLQQAVATTALPHPAHNPNACGSGRARVAAVARLLGFMRGRAGCCHPPAGGGGGGGAGPGGGRAREPHGVCACRQKQTRKKKQARARARGVGLNPACRRRPLYTPTGQRGAAALIPRDPRVRQCQPACRPSIRTVGEGGARAAAAEGPGSQRTPPLPPAHGVQQTGEGGSR